MAIGLPMFDSSHIDEFKDSVHPEQVLTYFGIPIESNNKILCPFHAEKTPSCHINDDYLYCFGCKKGWNTFDLAWKLREKKEGQKFSLSEMLSWIKTVVFPARSSRKYSNGTSCYIGNVEPALIDYWSGQIDDDKINTLQKERLFTPETIKKYKIGWRPDYSAWSIPFFAGELGSSEIDIVQFRMTLPTATSKYLGLAGHNRGAVMNRHLLNTRQDYVVILFGAFDSILSVQDGLIAVGFNGCMPFRQDEKERVQKMFEKQDTIFVVPDNTSSEYASAYMVAEWLNAEVRFFPTDLPDGTDYIDYRRQGYNVEDFKRNILGIEPVKTPDPNIIETVTEYLKVGDPYKFASQHVLYHTSAIHDSPVDIARTIAKLGPIGPFNLNIWITMRKKLWGVKTSEELTKVLDSFSDTAKALKGIW